MEATVKKQTDLRPGRGFSLSEIQKIGLSAPQARKLGLYVDPRRRSLHESNVKALEIFMKERQKQLAEKEEMREEEIAEEKKKPKKKVKKEKKVEEKPRKKKKVEKKEVKKAKKEEIPVRDITEIKGVGKKRAEEFKAAGISTVEDLLKVDTEKLVARTKFTADYIEKLKEKARAL